MYLSPKYYDEVEMLTLKATAFLGPSITAKIKSKKLPLWSTNKVLTFKIDNVHESYQKHEIWQNETIRTTTLVVSTRNLNKP